MGLEKLKDFWFRNKILICLFFISTLFFLFQHSCFLGWDFSAYSINARYLFHGGDYCEVYRAPLISVILGLFMFFGSASHYIFIIFTSALFFYSTISLSDSLYKNYFEDYKFSREQMRTLFYLILLTPFLLINGLSEGTELLALSFIQLFLASLFSKKTSGHFLALAFLSRYNFLLFFPIIFFEKNIKNILKNISAFVLTIIPWLLFNLIRWGNPFVSLLDSVYLNIASRQEVIQSFNLVNLFYLINYLLPLLLVGLFVFFYRKIWKKKISKVFIFVSVLLLWEVYTIPFKLPRYLFNLVIPISFFSLIGVDYILNKFKISYKQVLGILLMLFFISIGFISYGYYITRDSGKIYSDSADVIVREGYGNCEVLSNYWVPINYYSGNVYFLGNLNESIKNNKIVFLIKGYDTIDDSFSLNELESYPTLYEDSRFIILGNKNLVEGNCTQRYGYDRPMLSNPCGFLSNMFERVKLDKPINKLCLLVSR